MTPTDRLHMLMFSAHGIRDVLEDLRAEDRDKQENLREVLNDPNVHVGSQVLAARLQEERTREQRIQILTAIYRQIADLMTDLKKENDL